MKVLAIESLSGGQGKTTIAFLISVMLAEQGFKVLAVDADPQANLTLYMHYQVNRNEPTMLELIKGNVEPAHTIYQSSHENLWLVPADEGLEDAKNYLATTGMAATVLRGRLSKLESAFDYCVIDSPPQRNQICVTVAGAADKVIVPAEAVTKGVRSMQRTLQTIDALGELGGLKVSLKDTVLCTVPFRNKFTGRHQTIQSRDAIFAMEKIAKQYEISVFPAIPESEKYKFAVNAGQSLGSLGFPDLAYSLERIISAVVPEV